jgi:hypothetical protein
MQSTALDTSSETRRIQLDRLRSMSAVERMELSEVMWRDCDTLAREGIRQQHGDVTPERMRFHLLERRYGRSLAEQVFPGVAGV